MSNDNCNSSAREALSLSDIISQATALCNELDELTTLHHFFYQSAEHYFDDHKLYFKRGLSLLPSMLRERDQSVLDNMHQLQELLRSFSHPD